MTKDIGSHLEQRTPAATLLGREILETSAEDGSLRVRFLARPEFANRHGTVQGGLLAAMLDSATAYAVLARLPANRTALTTDLRVSFVRPAPIGPLLASSRIVQLADTEATAEAELCDSNGTVVARATSALRIVARS